jgi:hypothetical protein
VGVHASALVAALFGRCHAYEIGYTSDVRQRVVGERYWATELAKAHVRYRNPERDPRATDEQRPDC